MLGVASFADRVPGGITFVEGVHRYLNGVCIATRAVGLGVVNRKFARLALHRDCNALGFLRDGAFTFARPLARIAVATFYWGVGGGMGKVLNGYGYRLCLAP